MKPVVTPLHPLFFAKITEVDLARPIDETTQTAIERAMDEYAVCVMPGQHLEDEELIAFSRLYGPLEVDRLGTGRKAGAIGDKRRIAHREIFDSLVSSRVSCLRARSSERSSCNTVARDFYSHSLLSTR